MGRLAHVGGLLELVRDHKLDTLVETGTGHGDTVRDALQVKELTDIRSIEIDPETHGRAKLGLRGERRVQLYEGDSVEVLRRILATLEGRRVLWFLDAHYPGSARAKPVPMTGNTVPLLEELEALRSRDLSRDVIVIDDLCLFEPGTYDVDYPKMREELGHVGLASVDKELAPTHWITRLTRDGGYYLATPRL